MGVVSYLERLLFDLLRLFVLVAAGFAVVRRSKRDDSALRNVKNINNGNSKTHERVLGTPKCN